MPTIVLTSGTQWFVPPDCQTATIEAIGAGAGATYISNHGGSYAKSTKVALTPGSIVNIGIPAGQAGGTAWLNKANEIKYTPSQVYWSGTQFVGLDPTNNIVTSPDGVVWTQKLGALTYLGFAAGGASTLPVVTANNNLIFAASYDFPSLSIKSTYSTNGGTTWNAGTTFSSNFVVTGLSFLNGAFVLIVRTSSSGVYTQYTSSDAITWTLTQTYTEPSGTSPFVLFAGINRSIFANSLYANVGQSRIAGVITQAVGSSSTLEGTQTLNSPVGLVSINGIAYGNGLWVIILSDGFCNNGGIYTATSPNGPWTQRTSGTSNFIGSIVFDGTKFIVSEARRVLTSTNGINWTIYNTPFLYTTFTNPPALVVSGSATYACSSNEGIAKSTDNGTTWTKILTGTGAPVLATNGVAAAGGLIAPASQAANSIYTAGVGNFYQGGNGNGGGPTCAFDQVPAGGGGAGPNGAGGNGGSFGSTNGAGGGGGANGGGNGQNGSTTNSGAGGTSRLAVAGGAGGSIGSPTGGNGTSGSGGGGGFSNPPSTLATAGNGSLDSAVWTDFARATYGVGSGGGGNYGNIEGNSGGPGGGGRGTLGQGIIVITYTPAPVSGTYTQAFTSSQPVYIPAGITQIFAQVIGPGSQGGKYTGALQSGGGGGAYAESTILNPTPGAGFANVPTALTFGETADSWFNAYENAVPTLAQGALAKGASSGTGGAGSGASIGSVVYSGGTGGNSVLQTSGTFKQRGGGGAGAAGPSGVGRNGGSGSTSGTPGSGGGGGGGGTNGGSSTAGGTTASTTGGSGGSGPTGTAGGSGGTTIGSLAVAGNNGSGGGGGSASTSTTVINITLRSGANGSQFNISAWTASGVTYGPGSGGGGGGVGSGTTVNLYGNGGNAGGYGAGGGAASGQTTQAAVRGAGTGGLVVITYTVVGTATPTSKVYYGSTNITNIKLGNITVNSIYYGSIKVY